MEIVVYMTHSPEATPYWKKRAKATVERQAGFIRKALCEKRLITPNSKVIGKLTSRMV
jgi:hypothetical protein